MEMNKAKDPPVLQPSSTLDPSDLVQVACQLVRYSNN